MIEFKLVQQQGFFFLPLFESTAEAPNAVTTIWTQSRERRRVMESDLMGTANNSMFDGGAGSTRNSGHKQGKKKGIFRLFINRNSLWKRAPQVGGGDVRRTCCRHKYHNLLSRGCGNKEKEIGRICLCGVGRRTVVPKNIMP